MCQPSQLDSRPDRRARHRLWVLLISIILGALYGAGCGRFRDSERFQEQVRSRVQAQTPPQFADNRNIWKITETFYRQRNFQAAWSRSNWLYGRRQIRPEATELLKCLRKARAKGLDPDDYPIDELSAHLNDARRAAIADLVQLDLELSYTFIQYASHLYRGRVNPKSVGALLLVSSKNKDLAQELERALSGKRIAESLARLAPTLPDYQALRQVLPGYYEIARQGGWPMIATAAGLRSGDRSDAVSALRLNLQRQGDLVSTSTEDSSLFDEQLAQGVGTFESRNGLPVDGVADPVMIAVANEPVESVIRKVEMNLERMRWLPDDLGQCHLRVNIPDFRLAAVEQGKTVLEMRVVVGKKENPTPLFSDKMTYLIFNPYWNIPEGIALKETLPLLLKDPRYAEKHGIEVVRKGEEDSVVKASAKELKEAASDENTFPYLFRQQPGPMNALGKVKFMFPNQFNVYMHDTPSRHFFNRPERDYSHGCVRVEQPLELAEYLLRAKPGWNAERIRKTMQSSGEEETVSLPEALPVHLVYWTAWVDSTGKLQRRQDIYGQDSTLEGLLTTPSRLRQLTTR